MDCFQRGNRGKKSRNRYWRLHGIGERSAAVSAGPAAAAADLRRRCILINYRAGAESVSVDKVFAKLLETVKPGRRVLAARDLSLLTTPQAEG